MVDVFIISIATGVITGTTTGLLVAWFVTRRRPAPVPPNRSVRRARLDADAIAREWAETTGRPGFGPILADKLRTAESIMRRRERRQEKRRTSWLR